jgi:hypothetical protein
MSPGPIESAYRDHYAAVSARLRQGRAPVAVVATPVQKPATVKPAPKRRHRRVRSKRMRTE